MNKKELEMLYYIVGGKHLSFVKPVKSESNYADRKIG